MLQVVCEKMFVESKEVVEAERFGEASLEESVEPPKEASVNDSADGFRWIGLVLRSQDPSLLYCLETKDCKLNGNGEGGHDGNGRIISLKPKGSSMRNVEKERE